MNRFIISCSVVAAMALTPGGAAAKPTKVDKQNASQQCKAQRAEMGVEAFRQLYGKPAGAKNALGKCVSKHSREEETEREDARENAAKACKAEREADPEAFRTKYGTGKQGRNAHGKCVSQTAKANKQQEDEADAARDSQKANAAKACREEQKADPAAFRDKYGTGERKRNAFGKCVSTSVKKDDGEA